MARKTAPATDLFGDPYQPIRDRRGRPSLRFGEQAHETVKVLAAAEMSDGEIAEVLEVDDKTLRKYFSRDLALGRSKVRAAVIVSVFKAAMSGKAGSQRLMLDLIDDGQLPAPGAGRQPAAKPEKLGKKAQADRDAQTAHEESGWSGLLQ